MAISELAIEDVGTLVAAVKVMILGHRSQLWFRGHSDSAFKLSPSAIREGYSLQGERYLAGMFRLRAPSRHKKCPSVRDFAGWLSLMRHYGLPTRLLDWTESVLTAAFFAVGYDRRSVGPAHIWVLDPGKLNTLFYPEAGGDPFVFDAKASQVRQLVSPVFSTNVVDTEKVCAVFGAEVDLRMLMQQAAFTVHGLRAPLEETSDAGNFLTKLVIPEGNRRHFANELRYLGVNVAGIFPDLSHLGAGLVADCEVRRGNKITGSSGT